MRNIDRIYPFCYRLAELWMRYCPDWRFTQLIDNIQSYYQSDLFYVEDADLMEKIEKCFVNVFEE